MYLTATALACSNACSSVGGDRRRGHNVPEDAEVRRLERHRCDFVNRRSAVQVCPSAQNSFGNEALALPMYPELADEQAERVADALRAFFRG
jgi:dTDP-4-amino-4,6-dideoxygalactose transaminase